MRYFLVFLAAIQALHAKTSEGTFKTFEDTVSKNIHILDLKKGVLDGDRVPSKQIAFTPQQIEASKKGGLIRLML